MKFNFSKVKKHLAICLTFILIFQTLGVVGYAETTTGGSVQTIYVDRLGDDSKDGLTEETAVKTFEKAKELLNTEEYDSQVISIKKGYQLATNEKISLEGYQKAKIVARGEYSVYNNALFEAWPAKDVIFDNVKIDLGGNAINLIAIGGSGTVTFNSGTSVSNFRGTDMIDILGGSKLIVNDFNMENTGEFDGALIKFVPSSVTASSLLELNGGTLDAGNGTALRIGMYNDNNNIINRWYNRETLKLNGTDIKGDISVVVEKIGSYGEDLRKYVYPLRVSKSIKSEIGYSYSYKDYWGKDIEGASMINNSVVMSGVDGYKLTQSDLDKIRVVNPKDVKLELDEANNRILAKRETTVKKGHASYEKENLNVQASAGSGGKVEINNNGELLITSEGDYVIDEVYLDGEPLDNKDIKNKKTYTYKIDDALAGNHGIVATFAYKEALTDAKPTTEIYSNGQLEFVASAGYGLNLTMDKNTGQIEGRYDDSKGYYIDKAFANGVEVDNTDIFNGRLLRESAFTTVEYKPLSDDSGSQSVVVTGYWRSTPNRAKNWVEYQYEDGTKVQSSTKGTVELTPLEEKSGGQYQEIRQGEKCKTKYTYGENSDFELKNVEFIGLKPVEGEEDVYIIDPKQGENPKILVTVRLVKEQEVDPAAKMIHEVPIKEISYLKDDAVEKRIYFITNPSSMSDIIEDKIELVDWYVSEENDNEGGSKVPSEYIGMVDERLSYCKPITSEVGTKYYYAVYSVKYRSGDSWKTAKGKTEPIKVTVNENKLKSVMLDNSGIRGEGRDSIYFKGDEWIVLSKENGNDGEYKNSNNESVDPKNATLLLRREPGPKSAWRYNNGAIKPDSFLSSLELSGLLRTTKTEDWVTDNSNRAGTYYSVGIDDAQFFNLSKDEVGDLRYGFSPNKTHSDLVYDVETGYDFTGGRIIEGYYSPTDPGFTNRYSWYLRTQFVAAGDGLQEKLHLSVSYRDGAAFTENNREPFYIRNAMNYDNSKILFTMDPEFTTQEVSSELIAVTKSQPKIWKATLLDDSRNEFAVEEKQISRTIGVDSNEVEFNYSNAVTGYDEYISALIADSNDEVLYYGKLKDMDDAEADGKVTMNIPENLGSGEYNIKLFSEKDNGKKGTNASSPLVNVKLNNKRQDYTNYTVNVKDVSLNEIEAVMAKGSSLELQEIIKPENATNKKVRWSSSDEEIATVDETGKVTALGVGSATITVTTEDGNKTAKCEVTIKETETEFVSKYIEFDREDSKKIDTKDNQSKDKIWTVRFNKSVKLGDYLNSNIFVVDKDNYSQNVRIEKGEDSESIKIIAPEEGYKSGETYTIVIKDVKSENGKLIDKVTIMNFSIE